MWRSSPSGGSHSRLRSCSWRHRRTGAITGPRRLEEGPTGRSARIRAQFAKHIVDDGFTGQPQIDVSRLVEEGDVVVAEGSVRAPRVDGGVMHVVFCDAFEMQTLL